jgi:hypothetical protein
VAGVSRNLRARLRAMAGAPDVEARAAALADGVTVLLGALDAAEMMIADTRRAPAPRAAEDERADVVAFLGRLGRFAHGFGNAAAEEALTEARRLIDGGDHVGEVVPPTASLADAGKALDAEGGK